MTPISRDIQEVLERGQHFVEGFSESTPPRPLYVPAIRLARQARTSEFEGSFGNIGNSSTHEKWFLVGAGAESKEQDESSLEDRIDENVRFALMQQQEQVSKVQPSYWMTPPRSSSYTVTKVNQIVGMYSIGAANGKGTKPYQEDRFFLDQVTFREGTQETQIPIVGVCDGHGGFFSAQHVSKKFTKTFLSHFNSLSKQNIYTALQETCTTLHRQIQESRDLSGTTLTIALIFPERVWLANVGDSRALLVSKDGSTHQLTEDMELTISRYRQEIEEKGGRITRSLSEGSERVNNEINMARSLGDVSLDSFISRLPEVTASSFSEDDTLILGTDGLFFVATTDEVGAFANKFPTSDPATLAEGLVRKALEIDADDNITALVLKRIRR